MRELLKKIAPEQLKTVYRKLRSLIIRAEFALFGHLPIEKKRVVLCNVWGYGDNPKWIARALRASDKSLEIVFIAGGVYNHKANGIHFVPNNSLAAAYYLSTAHVWVDCNRKEPYISKREGQFYIQTWHGSIPLKKIEGDYPGLTSSYLQNAYRDSKMTDLYVSNGSFIESVYGRAFKYSGQCLRAGSARLDPLINPNPRRTYNLKKKFKQMAGIDRNEDIGVAVYAPTFRDHGEWDAESFNPDRIVEELEKKYSRQFVLVVRLHPIENSHWQGSNGTKVIDGNLFSDLYEIMEACDVLITDYSNTMFECALAHKKVFLFAPDKEDYNDERGMYFEYDKLPFPISTSMSELADAVASYSDEIYRPMQDQFFEELGVREDGHASLTVAQAIVSKVYNH